MKTITKNCLNCNNEFNASVREVNRGNAKFCCLKCACVYNAAQRPKLKPNTECAWCHKQFYRDKTKFSLSKSGLHFCSNAHKNRAQRIDGLKQLHPLTYGTGTNYRAKMGILEEKR